MSTGLGLGLRVVEGCLWIRVKDVVREFELWD